uniref:uncharacterized protein n=1 Tax=Pristiophorus japonicus TaxID=55135 RepID=UPI00398EC590
MASKRGKVARRFSDTSLEVMVQAVKTRGKVLFPASGKKVHSSLSKKAWVEVAEEVSRLSVTPRTWIQCRKRFNDLTRSAREKAAHNMRSKIGGGSADTVALSQVEQMAMEICGTARALCIGDGEAGGFSKQVPSPPPLPPPQKAVKEEPLEEDIPPKSAESVTASPRSSSSGVPTPDGTESELEGPTPSEAPSKRGREQVQVAGAGQASTRRRVMSSSSSAEWDKDADFRDPAMKRKMLEAHHRLYDVLEGLPKTLSTMSESMEESTSAMCGVVSHVISTLQTTLESATASRDAANESSPQATTSPTIEALMKTQTAAIQTLGTNVCSSLDRLVLQMDNLVDHVDRGFERVTLLLKSALPQVGGGEELEPCRSNGSAAGLAGAVLSRDTLAPSPPPPPPPAMVPKSQAGPATAKALQSAAVPSRARAPRGQRSQASQEQPQQPPATSFAATTGGSSRRSSKVGLSH